MVRLSPKKGLIYHCAHKIGELGFTPPPTDSIAYATIPLLLRRKFFIPKQLIRYKLVFPQCDYFIFESQRYNLPNN